MNQTTKPKTTLDPDIQKTGIFLGGITFTLVVLSLLYWGYQETRLQAQIEILGKCLTDGEFRHQDYKLWCVRDKTEEPQKKRKRHGN